MLAINIDNQPADIFPETTLELSVQNTHLLPSEVTTSTTAYCPTLPLTPTNSRLLGRFDLFQASIVLPQVQHKVDAYHSGHLLSSGSFIIIEASDKGFVGGIVENISEIFGAHSATLLHDLPLPDFTIPSSHGPEIGSQVTFPTLHNSQYYGSSAPPNYTGKINNYLSGAYTANSPRVPFFRVSYILNLIANLTGVSIDVDTTLFDNLVIVSLKAEEPTVAFPIATHLPSLTIGKFLVELKKLRNIKIDVDVFNKSIKISAMQGAFYAHTPIDWSSKLAQSISKTPESTPGVSVSFKIDSSDTYLKENPSVFEPVHSWPDMPSTHIECLFSSIPRHTDGLGILEQEGGKKHEPRIAFFTYQGSTPTAHCQSITPSLPITPSVVEGQDLTPSGVLALHADLVNIRQNAFYYKVQLNLTAQDLNHDLTRQIHLNGLNFLIVSMSAKLPLTELVECMLIKI